MNLFSSIFGNNENGNSKPSKVDWIPLTQISQLDEIIMVSSEKPVVIFKHSTGCGISRMALKQFEKNLESGAELLPYYLDLLSYRAVSNAVEERFSVKHQSPQLLLIKNGKSVYAVSHGDIDAVALRKEL